MSVSSKNEWVANQKTKLPIDLCDKEKFDLDKNLSSISYLSNTYSLMLQKQSQLNWKWKQMCYDNQFWYNIFKTQY